jgi:predicted lactoylglutathione lyase
MTPHEDLPVSYLASCEKFFRALGKKRNKFQASSSNATRHNLFTEIEERSRKRQASSNKRLTN